MGPVYIAVADSTKARIYAQSSRGQALSLVQDLEHEDAGRAPRAFVSDRPGIRKSASGAHASTFSPSTDAHDVEQRQFAHAIAGVLDHGRASGRYDELVLVMGPRMLGLVKAELSAEAHKRIAATIDADVHPRDDVRLVRALREGWFVPTHIFGEAPRVMGR